MNSNKKIARQEFLKQKAAEIGSQENAIKNFFNVFDRIGSGIDSALGILCRNGENNLNKSFNAQEAEDFLKRFK
jgi:hypothetical protein